MSAVAPIHQLLGAWRSDTLYQHPLLKSIIHVLKMHVHIENRINKTNKIYIILEILGGRDAPSIGATESVMTLLYRDSTCSHNNTVGYVIFKAPAWNPS